MAFIFRLVNYVSVLIIAELGLRVNASCNAPAKTIGTHHNASLAVHNSGTVLYFTCDSGYHTNYYLPYASCLNSGVWNPPDLTCQINTSSLVAAIAVAVVALSIFMVIVNLIRRKYIPRQRNAYSPEHPPETFEMSRPQSLYDFVRTNRRITGISQDPTDQRSTSVALTGLSEIRDQADYAIDGLENPGQVNKDSIDITDAGGIEMTGALTSGSSRSHDYENTGIKRQRAGVRVHSYENTGIKRQRAGVRVHSYENTGIKRQRAGVRVHSYENTAIPNNKKLFN